MVIAKPTVSGIEWATWNESIVNEPIESLSRALKRFSGSAIQQAMLFELACHHADRQRCPIDRWEAEFGQQVRERANVVFVAVGQQDSLDLAFLSWR